MVANGSAKSTIAKKLRLVREFYNVAVRRKLVTSNPFSHCKDAVKGDPSKRVFVPAEVIEKVIEVLPTTEWRLLAALERIKNKTSAIRAD